jgi:pimeloyl-ACP methyl ester carboxylesterase
VAVPTLAVVGADDGCIPPSVSADQAERFTGEYRREVIAGAGHWPHRETPDAATALILEWFRS